MSKINYIEPFAEERIEIARAFAQKILAGNYDDEKEAEYMLRAILSRHYGIPFFSEYFDKRTFDELIFEAELIKLPKKNTEIGNELLSNSKKETEELFDDMVAADDEQWNSVNPSSDTFMEDAKRFMETGNFKE